MTSKRVVIIEVCDLFVVATGLGRRVIFFSLRSSSVISALFSYARTDGICAEVRGADSGPRFYIPHSLTSLGCFDALLFVSPLAS
jgi:hypothetical protein